MPFSLVEHSFLNDNSHDIFIGEIIFGQLESVKHFLPFWRDVFTVESAVSKVERDRCVFLERNNLRLVLNVFFLLVSEKVFDFGKEASFLLLFLCLLLLFSLNGFVFLFGRAIRLYFVLHDFSFFFCSELKSDAASGIVEEVETLSDHPVILLKAIVDFYFENHCQRLQVINSEELRLEMTVHIDLQKTYHA